MKLKEIKRKILRIIGNYFLYHFVNVLCNTLRINIINQEAVERFFESNKNVAIAFWHGTMLVPWYIHRRKNFAALISKSKDGDLLAKLLIKWKYKVARGSSHKGGKEALDIIYDFVRTNYSVSITPDGPTGPPNKMKAGAVITAKKTGLPLFLVGATYCKKYILNSWDKFEIPKPFSKINIKYSEPIFISKDLDYETTNLEILKREEQLNSLQKETEEIC